MNRCVLLFSACSACPMLSFGISTASFLFIKVEVDRFERTKLACGEQSCA